MKAVMYGGGNIGRGFIGALFSKSGYEVTFIDVSDKVVDTLNRDHRYPLRYVSDGGHTDEWIENVCAVNGNDTEAVARAIAECDIMATAVGARILPFIAPNIARGITLRDKPLNILICENLMDADKVLRGLVKDALGYEPQNVGFIETSIGRMVPVQTEDMQDGEPLRVCVEKYGFLPVDKSAFIGDVPEIAGMVPFSPFDYYIKRKLFLHNMGHAVCAYLGSYMGYEYISDAINDPEIYITVQSAMIDSARALSCEYGVNLNEILPHISDLLYRFKNPALHDTCARVGADPVRKLGAADRLIGASLLCEKQGILPAYTAIGAAGALISYEKVQDEKSAKSALAEIAGLTENSKLSELIITFYNMLKSGASVRDIKNKAEAIKQKNIEII